MFDGSVERQSHEGGLLVPFTGPSPALGSVLVDGDGQYVGKVDAVLGTTEAPLVHLAHLDRNRSVEETIGVKVTIRARQESRFRNDYGGRGRDRYQSNDRGRGRDDRRGGRDRYQSNDRGRGRDDRRGGSRGGDWDCPKCNNSNFAFRTECNRCGEPRGDAPSKPGDGGFDRRNDRRGGFDRRNNDRRGGFDRRNDRRGGGRDNSRNRGDWDCPKCNNLNYSFRTECNSCGEPRGDTPGRPRDDRGGRGRDGGYDRRNNDRRGGFDRRNNDQRGGGRERGSYEPKPGDWTCNDCGANNFASRTTCYKCGPDARSRGGGGDRRGPRQGRGYGGGGDRRGPRQDRGYGGGGDRRGPRQGRDGGGDRRGPRQDRGGQRDGGQSRIRPKGARNPFRKSRGKADGHAHNRGPKPIRRPRSDDD
ncbi:MAG TPA: hypothetical protein D7I05_00340 [Candidatus Poseidoniales archaeon]|nr:MAG TPA: hypothetical protein D7I05_00340 [Candidatus Poseidoniales archaeon]